MRSLRWLLLVVIAVIAAGVFQVYRLERIAGKKAQRPTPRAMPLGDKADALDWEWGQTSNGKPAVKVTAREMRQTADSKKSELKDIELRIYKPDGKTYDRVRSAFADFNLDDHKLYAPGDAEITLEVPVEGEPKHPLTSITAAGINFDSDSGKAVTDKHVAFVFENGRGVCDGGSYDPQITRNSPVARRHCSSEEQRPQRPAHEGGDRGSGLQRNRLHCEAGALGENDSRSNRDAGWRYHCSI